MGETENPITSGASPFNYPGLPKWPQMRVKGLPVTLEQASEIIRRTDTFFSSGYGGGNDKAWNRQVKRIVGMPLGDDSCDEFYGESKDWQTKWKLEQTWQEAWGCISTEYVHNSWVSCSFIGGPHGWCSPAGQISFRDNVGKWPSCEEIEADWAKLAAAFPFVDAEVVLMNGESCEDGAPVIGFIVKDGKVTPKSLDQHEFGQGPYRWENVGPSLQQQVMAIAMRPARLREAGVSEQLVRQWAVQNPVDLATVLATEPPTT